MASLATPQTSFVGRAEEIALVANLVREPDVRLVTLTGTGGIGKTRLAQRVAEELNGTFPNSVIVVPCAAIRDPALLLPTIAIHLGVPGTADQSLPNRLRAFLAERCLLLVLDNLEHLLDATPEIAELVADNPGLTILGTSRTRLNLSAERVVPLAPLPADHARQLFANRATALLPRFTLTDDLTSTLDAICRQLDFLPLAIELAAARVPVLPPRALLTELEHRLDILASGPRDAPARLRTMRDAIAWSHNLLTGEQRALFRRLAVFIDGFTIEAARAVAGEQQEVLEGLDALVTASLVNVPTGIGSEPRFAMLETIREFALEQLEASREIDQVRAMHADYFRRLSEAALPRYDGPEARVTVSRMEAELSNCRAAMTWALDTGNAESGLRLAGALWRVWRFSEVGGVEAWTERIVEGRSWLDRMLALDTGLPAEVVAEAYIGAGILAGHLGDADRVRELSDNMLSRSRAESYRYGVYWALTGRGFLAKEDGNHRDALACFEEMLELAPGLRNPEHHEAIALCCLGIELLYLGRVDEAETHFQLALPRSRASGSPAARTAPARGLARVREYQGDLIGAATHYRDDLIEQIELRDLLRAHNDLLELARLALLANLPQRAARLLGATTTFPGPPTRASAIEEGQSELPDRAAIVDRLRSMLCASQFDAAYDAGSAIRLEESVDEVDELIADIMTSASNDTAARHGLTQRQVEVLRLLAHGHGNRAIADTLSLSERTVEGHVLNILTRLNLDSRTAAALYAVRHDLT